MNHSLLIPMQIVKKNTIIQDVVKELRDEVSSFIDGFEEGLVGKKVGETVDLNLKFPENYGASELAGAAVVVLAVVAGVAAALLCNMENCLINTEVDSHIDGEGFSICLMTIVLNVVASIL